MRCVESISRGLHSDCWERISRPEGHDLDATSRTTTHSQQKVSARQNITPHGFEAAHCGVGLGRRQRRKKSAEQQVAPLTDALDDIGARIDDSSPVPEIWRHSDGDGLGPFLVRMDLPGCSATQEGEQRVVALLWVAGVDAVPAVSDEDQFAAGDGVVGALAVGFQRHDGVGVAGMTSVGTVIFARSSRKPVYPKAVMQPPVAWSEANAYLRAGLLNPLLRRTIMRRPRRRSAAATRQLVLSQRRGWTVGAAVAVTLVVAIGVGVGGQVGHLAGR